jgi:hypothetical protein
MSLDPSTTSENGMIIKDTGDQEAGSGMSIDLCMNLKPAHSQFLEVAASGPPLLL